MRNNKGFTLIELLAVLTVLAIILILGTGTVIKITKENRQKLYDEQINSYIDSIRMWGYDHISELPDEGESLKITLGELIEGNYAKRGVKNPLTKEVFSTDLYFCINNTNNKYTYELEGEC
ncbi:MAG: type II secretion system protein [Bacilli bacterium]|nr:type II secretion system protein [Bacilli bacterium]